MCFISTQVNDRYQAELSMATIQHARGLFSHYDVAWRECDRTKRLYTNLENCKQSMHRTRSLTARFQVSIYQVAFTYTHIVTFDTQVHGLCALYYSWKQFKFPCLPVAMLVLTDTT